MSEYTREKQLKKKREYYREWRAKNPEKVKASQAKYWTKQLEELKAASAGVECRSADH